MSEITSYNKKIEPGDIFYMKKRFQYYRVLLCDNYNLFYQDIVLYNFEKDLLKLSLKIWSSKLHFTGNHLKKFKNEKYPWVGYKALSEEEHKMLRPDLPIFFGRSKLLSWKIINQLPSYKDLFEFDEEFKKQLPIDSIFIQTYGARGTGKKIGQVISDHTGKLSIAQIMWESAQFQANSFEDERFGVGIYRLGIYKRSPLYYLFGYYDHGKAIIRKEFGTTLSTDVTLRNRELPFLGWKEYLKKKKIDKTSYKITVDEKKFPIKGSILKLFLEWNSEPVLSYRLSSNEFILDLSDYPPGPYIILLTNSKGNKYTGWYEYHLIRDDFDGWIYTYPDMKNITQYSKKIEEPKKIGIPNIRSNASMKKYEKKLKELLAAGKIQGRGEIIDMEEHGFQLHYFDLNEADSHFDALSEQGFQGGGPTWYGIISGAIQLADPTLNDEIYIDDDSEGIIISSKSKAVLEKMSRLIGILKSEPDLLAASIHIAEKNEMID